MRVNLKILLAVFLVVIAAGVVVYNVQYFAGSDSGASALDVLEYQDDPAGEEEEGYSMDGVPEGSGIPMDAVHRLLNGASGEGETPQGPRRAGRESGEASREISLGDEWRDSVWNQLLASFARRGGAGSKEDPLDPDLETTAPPRPPLETTMVHEPNRFKAQVDTLRVRGILYGDRLSAALINDGIYHSGDLIPGLDIAVAEIGRDHVLFRSTGSGETATKHLQPRCGPPSGWPDPAGEEGIGPLDAPGSPEGRKESGMGPDGAPARDIENK
jgi:hypothetical protein